MADITANNPAFENRKSVSDRGLSSCALKIIAMTVMFADHFAWIILDPLVKETVGLSFPYFIPLSKAFTAPCLVFLSYIFHIVGRMAMPIYLFLLSEGLTHTKNIYRYCFRILLFALISEVPFDLAFCDAPFFRGSQNVLFTLFFALVAMAAIEKCENRLYISVPVVIACCLAAYFLKTDYSFRGVIMGCIMVLFKKKRDLSVFLCGIFESLAFKLSELPSLLSILPLHFYNGRKGADIKYLFYAFYPAHLILICLIKLI